MASSLFLPRKLVNMVCFGLEQFFFSLHPRAERLYPESMRIIALISLTALNRFAPNIRNEISADLYFGKVCFHL